MPQTPEHPIEKPRPEETLEFLKRNEVRTMAKDVASLREGDAKRERDKIAGLKTESQAPLLVPASPARLVSESERAGGPSVPPQATELPKKPAHFDKVFIRVALGIGVVFVLANVAAFAVWNMKKNSEAETAPAPSAPVASEDSSLGTESSGRTSESERPSLFSLFQTLLSIEDTRGFTKVLVQDRVSELPFPSQLKEIIQDEFEVFSFVSQDKKRLGFIFQLQNSQGAQEVLRQWEPNMEEDLKPLWDSIGQKGSAYVPFFRQTSYQNSIIRFQTFSVKDLGIVYALLDSHLILASSLESMKAAIDQIIESR